MMGSKRRRKCKPKLSSVRLVRREDDDLLDEIIVQPVTPSQRVLPTPTTGLLTPPDSIERRKRQTVEVCLPIRRVDFGEENTSLVQQSQRKRVVKNRRVKRTWTDEELKALCVFRQEWKNTSKEIASILNKIFIRGAHTTITFRSNIITCQLHDLQRLRNRGKNGLWFSIFNQSTSVRDSLVARIRACAQSLGITLHKQDRTFIVNVKRASALWMPSSSGGPALSASSNPRNDNPTIARALAPPPTTDLRVAITDTGNPGLFWRFQSNYSGSVTLADGSIRARKFLGDADIPTPSSENSTFFLSEAANHLQRLIRVGPRLNYDRDNFKFIPTVFLSITESFIDAFIRAYKHYAQNKESDIVIMDSEIACAKAPIYSASRVMSKLRAHPDNIVDKRLIHRYYATYERLVWGELPRSAIHRSVPFSKIVNLASSDPAVNRLLRLDLDKSYSALKVSNARKLFSAKENRRFLDLSLARAIGKLAALFRLARSSAAIIMHFVYCMIQGFAIFVNLDDGEGKIPRRFGEAFVSGIGSVGENRNALHIGFAAGVMAAWKDLQKEMKRRP